MFMYKNYPILPFCHLNDAINAEISIGTVLKRMEYEIDAELKN
jgi:hypothetical protein